MDFKGTAKRLDDLDLPRIGARIGVGEDPIHALLTVETTGTGFDKQGRPKMLFEPHVFYRHLSGEKRARAIKEGLAYKNWGTLKYPSDSYPRLERAMEIDETAALMSASWGLGQVLGEHFAMLGYSSVQAMVEAFTEDEEHHLDGMIDFIIKNHIDDDLRRIEQKTKNGQTVTASDWVPVVRVYNGAGYARNDYHNRAAAAYQKWLRIKDTPYAPTDIREVAAKESVDHDAQLVTAPTPAPAAEAQAALVDLKPPAAPSAVVQVEKSEPVESPILKGIKTHYAAAISFVTTTGAGAIAMLRGLPSALIYGFFGAAAATAIVYIIVRVWLRNKENDRQLQRERMAHELTLAAMKTASDPKAITVEVK